MPHKTQPTTQMFSKGYDPQRSEGAAVVPVFRTSTFIFKTAAEGKRAFQIAYGLDTPTAGESPALIYTRVNNPNSEIVEDRVVAWDGTEAAALFSSGMGAISCSVLSFLRPGDALVFADPVYGGTEFFFRKILPTFGIKTIPVKAGCTESELEAVVSEHPAVKAIYLETPANPTLVMSDIAAARRVADRHSTAHKKVLVMVDNTMMGPLYSRPKDHGADLILYSATKFFGGHSDLVAGLALGSKEVVGQVKVTRTIFGANSDPDTAWLILRSLGTLQIRMQQQQVHAQQVVAFLQQHPKVTRVYYPGLESMGAEQTALFQRQCLGTGSLISFDVAGGEAEAFRVLDAVKHMKLAVSLGGIETLIEHPFSMTHADMTDAEKAGAGITPAMIRLSVGLEDPGDLIADLDQALAKI